MAERSFRIALVQMNSTVGALADNTTKILDAVQYARGKGADLVAFPELALSGYPPEDLLHAPRFLRACREALDKIVLGSAGITVLVGFPEWAGDTYNAAALIHDGALVATARKHYLPNYGVFDEDRYFQSSSEALLFTRRGVRVGVSICEDIWYPDGPPAAQALFGDAELLVNLSASPYERAKRARRRHMLATRAADFNSVVAFVNAVGGQDDLVFDGASAVFDARGRTLVEAQPFTEGILLADCPVDAVRGNRLHDSRRRKSRRQPGASAFTLAHHDLEDTQAVRTKVKTSWPTLAPAVEMSEEQEVYEALVTGLRDYVTKNRFEGVAIGLSGGIDSALTAAVAVDALGAKRVLGVTMPSRFSSGETKSDALVLAKNLGIRCETLAIEDTFQAYLKTLEPIFKKSKWNEAEENLQARIRGTLLMAVSNKLGPLILTTGNKSELSTGYATLYGDMAGGFNVLKDVFKTYVYRLAYYRNGVTPVIPPSTLERAPTAELRPNQKDQDSLPAYEVLDAILALYVEEDLGLDEIVSRGYEEALVRRVVTMVDGSEYKRRQSAPGVKISSRAFGRDRRVPITNRFKI